MKALVIIDMQNGYFKTPHLISQKNRLIHEINALIDDFSESNDLVINVKTMHSRDKSTWTLNMMEDGKGFVFYESEESENVKGLHVNAAVEIIKTRDSAFTHTDLQQTLDKHKITHLTLAGVSAHSCIFLTAADAYALNFSVSLSHNAIGDESEALKQDSFTYLAREYRQKVI